MPDPILLTGDAASGPAGWFLLALWLPMFSVVAWFMIRVFSGRWPGEVERSGPPAPPLHTLVERHDLPGDRDDDDRP